MVLRNTTIKQAQKEVEKFLEAQGKDWTQIDNHFYVFTHLSEEMGELARHIINADFDLVPKTRKHASRERTISQIEDDLGDILYHLFKLAVAYEIDLAEAFEKSMIHIKKKYGRQLT
jgi:NTP pyrophosphatase (non-canonical NTP hydrolase)